MTLLEMWDALPDGEKGQWWASETKWWNSFDIASARRKFRNNYKKHIKDIVEKAYQRYLTKLKEKEEQKNIIVKEPLWMSWEDGTQDEVFYVSEHPHEFGSCLEKFQEKK